MYVRCVIGILTLFACCGCHGYLRKPRRQLLPSGALLTRDGSELRADQGTLRLRIAPGDIEGILGVSLSETDAGLLVVDQLRGNTPLRSGDRLTTVLAATDSPYTLSAIHSDPAAEPIDSLPTLAPYALTPEGQALHLAVQRGGEEVAIAIPINRQLPLKGNAYAWFISSKYGIELIELDNWVDGSLPRHANSGDYLVLAVQEDSPAALAGLRPLDVIPVPPSRDRDLIRARLREGRFGTLGSSDGFRVLRQDGEHRIAVTPYYEPQNIWIPLIFSYESDGRRSHIGLGPLDVIYHSSSQKEYDVDSDAFVTRSRWSLLTCFRGVRHELPTGTSEDLGVSLILDPARTLYLGEYLTPSTDRVTFRKSPFE